MHGKPTWAYPVAPDKLRRTLDKLRSLPDKLRSLPDKLKRTLDKLRYYYRISSAHYRISSSLCSGAPDKLRQVFCRFWAFHVHRAPTWAYAVAPDKLSSEALGIWASLKKYPLDELLTTAFSTTSLKPGLEYLMVSALANAKYDVSVCNRLPSVGLRGHFYHYGPLRMSPTNP